MTAAFSFILLTNPHTHQTTPPERWLIGSFLTEMRRTNSSLSSCFLDEGERPPQQHEAELTDGDGQADY